ncbi:SSI family serine proteinase inhibitor [Streptomyces sp. SP17BM10]|uniref:SSI family serine proteinase inhibitor n=1 Tax=Streptomyces sp. SP17BM10 TaxID=3002530 RepID=UPI002E759A55|nr:SSI family serine proteinase inhibitor [Streptomyces sp. SP17BM10]MEE1782890.1 SSI family serine proteinase inhibitor [Streptomyces sp. SP17BM10]
MSKPRTTAAGVLALLALAAPATAATAAHARTTSANWLNVAVFTGSGDRELIGRDSATLHCPDDGLATGHPHAAQACRDLAAADGDVARIAHRDGMCPMIYSAVTAKAYGTWNGRHVEYGKTFANDCVMKAQTRAVFDFSVPAAG